MRRYLALCALLALSTCRSIPDGANCGFWDNVPKMPSEQKWRELDCPFVGSKNV